MRGRVVFTDLDGTLLTSCKNISEDNKKTINEFKERGGKFSIATGRVLESMEHFLDEIEVDLPVVLYNGAVVYDTKKKSYLDVSYLDTGAVEKAVDNYMKRYEELEIALIAFNTEGIYIHRETDYTVKRFSADSLTNFEIKPIDEIRKKKLVKLMVVGKLKNLLEFGRGLSGMNYFTSDSDILEILPQGVSKWTGIETSLKKDIEDVNHVYAFGDNQNDLQMIKKAHTGVAMKNGCKTIFSGADYISDFTNDEDGVGKFIEAAMEECYR